MSKVKSPESARRAGAARRARHRTALNAIKSQPCKDCEHTYPPYVMDFDHVRGKKEFEIGHQSAKGTMSFDRILEEIAKCELVCSNCHRIRTHLWSQD
jgi:hypothetical protein